MFGIVYMLGVYPYFVILGNSIAICCGIFYVDNFGLLSQNNILAHM